MTFAAQAIAMSEAAPQAVWDVLLDGRRWGLWNPGVEWMWLEGEPVPGTLATIKLARVRQTAFVVVEAAPPERFALALRVGPVARLELAWRLLESAGGTVIEGRVAAAGVAAALLVDRPAKRVAAAFPAHLERLAVRAAEFGQKDARPK